MVSSGLESPKDKPRDSSVTQLPEEEWDDLKKALAQFEGSAKGRRASLEAAKLHELRRIRQVLERIEQAITCEKI